MNSNKNMVYRGFPKVNKDGSIQPQEPDYFKEFLPDDSIPEPTDVYKELFDKKDKYGALVANPYNYQDLSIGALEGLTTTFLKLKSGKNLLTFNVDTNFKGEINIVWRNRYVTI